MAGLGTVINVAAIVAGGLGGLLFGKRMEKRYQDTLMSANGICVLFLGIAGCLKEMYTIVQGKVESGGTMMMIASFSIGALAGEWLNLELHMEQFGEWLKKKTKSDGDASFVDGFVTASMGKGCLFSAIPVGLFQGGITVLARLIEPIMTEQALSNLSLTGSMLIFCVGVNLIWGKKIKVANLLPTIVVAVGWASLT
ncbi:MAG: DUF554 domain-containing protein [Hungatella sp.]|nr:DUF554 domain-containing protein [Hungatella sp.]